MMTVPDAIPVTTPVEETDAMAGVPLVQNPEGVASVFVIVPPTQTWSGPVMATGAAITVIVTLVPQPPEA